MNSLNHSLGVTHLHFSGSYSIRSPCGWVEVRAQDIPKRAWRAGRGGRGRRVALCDPSLADTVDQAAGRPSTPATPLLFLGLQQWFWGWSA